MKKLFLTFISILTIYILIIFNLPDLANGIAQTFGLEKFNTFILKFKTNIDTVSTDIPTSQELMDTYEKAVSGAIDLKTNIIDGVDTTKEAIDSIRATLSGAEDTINSLKDGYQKATDFIESTSQKIEEARDAIDSIDSAITSTGTIQ